MTETTKTQCGICHIEIPAPDLAKARDFYSRVFGWTIKEEPSDTYWFFNDGEKGGAFDKSGTQVAGGVNLILSVDDIPAKLSEITNAGGAVRKEKTEIGGSMGFYAQFTDPNGNELSIWSKS